MALSPLDHEAYSFAAREYGALNLSGTPSDSEYRLLLGLVERYLTRKHPTLATAAIQSAARYGVATAVNVLGAGAAAPGVIGTIVGTAEQVPATVEKAAGVTAGAVETGAKAVAGAVETAGEAVVGRAVPIATDALSAWSGFSRIIAHVLPAHLFGSRNYRAATAGQIKRLARPVAATVPAPATTAAVKYFTYRRDVLLEPGETVHYTPGKGYYAAPSEAA